MRDALYNFGVITAGTSTTTYSAEEVYLGTITAAYRRSLHALGLVDDLAVRFVVTTVFATSTTQPGLYSDATTAPTTLCLAGAVMAYATLALGYSFTLPVPREVNLYLRPGVLTGGATTGALTAQLEFGPNIS